MFWKEILLGIIQGFTEFLPVSSSGHLVLVSEYLNISAPGNTLEVMLHFGTLFSVIFCFWSKVKLLIADFLSIFIPSLKVRAEYQHASLYIIVASIPAVITGVLLNQYFESMFDSVLLTGIFLMVTGAILFWAHNYSTGRREMMSMTFVDALIIGIFQSLAVFPGISRAGTTISAGFVRGFDKETAVEWSFLMSIPIIAGAALLKIPEVITSGSFGWGIVWGALAAFITGVIAIKLLLTIIRRLGWRIFAYYCWAIGGIVIVTSII